MYVSILATLLVLSVLGACVESTTLRCQDLICPTDSQCVELSTGPACASRAQQTACDGVSSGTSCVIDGRAGTCDSGVCIGAVCGNGVLELGEDCDGDVSTMACSIVGYYDGTLRCNSVCRFDASDCQGRCGDALRNGNELCDAEDGLTASCQEFGYYGGTVQCNAACGLDISQCEGRCGDGVRTSNEICDGGVAPETTCESLGYYAGVVTCTAACSVDIASCGGRCGDGLQQSAFGEVCDDGNTRNGDISGADACSFDCLSDQTCGNGIVDSAAGEECDAGLAGSAFCRAPTGVANDGGCLIVRCGNHFLDAGEICDDGNRTEGDGCASDCKSTQTCGNGIIDTLVSETCDEGSLGVGLSGDGCSSGCDAETPGWTARTFPNGPSRRVNAAMVFDAARGKIVLFGGFDDVARVDLSDTWEFDGLTWTQRFTATTPEARNSHAMAYDSTRKRIVMTGGFSRFRPDTWEFDGTDWTRSLISLPPFIFHKMAYHAASEQMLVVEPKTGSTWISYRGFGWQRLPSMPAPSPRRDYSMAYDVKRSKIVLFGGYAEPTNILPPMLNDTWEFDGRMWKEVPITGFAPTPRRGHVMAFETACRWQPGICDVLGQRWQPGTVSQRPAYHAKASTSVAVGDDGTANHAAVDVGT
jgi:cysteine-rich repeat protein